MHVIEVRRPLDRLFIEALQRILRFALEVPGSQVPVAWYSLKASTAYFTSDPLVILLALVDEDGQMHGHCFAAVEESYGRRLGWVYQTEVQKTVPQDKRLPILRTGLRALEAWAKANGCVALGMATAHPTRTMGRLFGFSKTVALLERPLGDSR